MAETCKPERPNERYSMLQALAVGHAAPRAGAHGSIL
eukprot:COSAG01_NODE_7335_length_3246_cov_3.993963_5_plen_37_part_00